MPKVLNTKSEPAKPEYSLAGHCALVTGSSRGIGSAIAFELARAGADVYIHCFQNADRAELVCNEIRRMGRKSSVRMADLSDVRATTELCGSISDVDILVLNASVQIKKPWQEMTDADFYTQVNCNYLSSMLLMQAVAGSMKEKGWGRIVTIGSVQQKKPHPEMLVYSSSKCAQYGLVQALAPQLASYGITVNNVAPGVIDTDRNAEILKDTEYAAQVIKSIPAGFLGKKEDVAGIVRLLCSDAGRYITGQNIFADGGKSL